MTSTSDKAANSYLKWRQADFNLPEYYPLDQTVDPAHYVPQAAWQGRLILPAANQRTTVRGCLFEVHHAPEEHRALVGQVVYLRWADTPAIKQYLELVTQPMHFNELARKGLEKWLVLPERLDGWDNIDPLESLAGAHPYDDVVVMLRDAVTVQPPADGDEYPSLYIVREPAMMTGRYVGLVQFVAPAAAGSDLFMVRHYNRSTQQFDGDEETVRLPAVLPNTNDIPMAVTTGLQDSPGNAEGWYIYGAKDAEGVFTVQAYAPRALLRVKAQEVRHGADAAWQFVRRETWEQADEYKGQFRSVLLNQRVPRNAMLQQWEEGGNALLVHVYAGIGGKLREPATRGGIYFGHFAYGSAKVVRDPLSDDLIFDLLYYQVYTHNHDGLIAGVHTWSHYMGDRQRGWLGVRPVVDMLINFDPFDEGFPTGENAYASALDVLEHNLEIMSARYRIGDGNGSTWVGPANNCSQDANQALYRAIQQIDDEIANNEAVDRFLATHTSAAKRAEQLIALLPVVRKKLVGRRQARKDWQQGIETLGEDGAGLGDLLRGLGSWRTVLPRKASDTVARIFIERGASVWVLATFQVGGDNPDIEPFPPITF